MNEKFMKKAVEKASEGIEKGQSPFGACIVKNKKIISCEHNTVFMDTDITAHAEINAIREACRKMGTLDLSGCEIYSTCEPCPMCFSACHWAGISRVYYGAEIADAKKAGFNEIELSNRKIKEISKLDISISGGILRKECIALFKKWSEKEGSKPY